MTLTALVERWRDVSPKERANAQLYITELCDALGVEKPRPPAPGYEFEFAVTVVHRDGTEFSPQHRGQTSGLVQKGTTTLRGSEWD